MRFQGFGGDEDVLSRNARLLDGHTNFCLCLVIYNSSTQLLRIDPQRDLVLVLTLCTVKMSVTQLESTLDSVDDLAINLIGLLHPDGASAISDLHHNSVNQHGDRKQHPADRVSAYSLKGSSRRQLDQWNFRHVADVGSGGATQ